MSSIRNISASNPMPVDLAKRIGKNGVVEVLSVMWQGYDDLRTENVITSDMNENSITQEWYLRVNERWHRENRASRISVRLSPTVQYEDDTLAKTRNAVVKAMNYVLSLYNLPEWDIIKEQKRDKNKS